MNDYVALAIATPLAIMTFLGGATLLEATSAQAALHTAAGIADRSMVADGCLTPNALTALDATISAAHMNPKYLQFTGTTAGRSYGTTGINVGLTYNLGLTFPGTQWQLLNTRIHAQVSGDQSQYVPYDGATTACASSSQVSGVFAGDSVTGGSMGSTVSLPSEPTGITESVTPTTTPVGSPVTIAGVVSGASGPMPGISVAINLGAEGETHATTNAQGLYTATMTPTATGSVPVGVTSGSVTASKTLTVVAAQPSAIVLTVPPSVTVDQAFTITGIVTTANGNAVADGTSVTVSASNRAFAAQTANTVGGQFTVDIPGGVAQAGTVTITASAGSASTTASLLVNPGAPQSVTLSASPTRVAAGSSVTLSGVVEGPGGTPPAKGTSVAIGSSTDPQDSFPILSTNSSGDFAGSTTLTLAGTQSLTATAGTAQSRPIAITVTSGAPYTLSNLSANPSAVNQGATTIIEGQVLDAYGNPEPANTVVTLTSSAWPSAVTTETSSDGMFSAPVTFAHAGDQTVTVNSGAASGSVSVLVNPQGAYVIQAAQSGTTLTAGQSTTVTWTMTDSQGQPVEGKILHFAASPTSGVTLSATSATTNSAGQATLTMTDTQAGTLEVTASANGVTGTAVWTVQAGSPAILADPTIAPSVAQSTSDGGTVYPALTGLVEDAYGNPIPSASLSATGGWDASATVTGTTASDGTFSLPLTPETVGGPYTPSLTVSDSHGRHTFTPGQATLTVVKQLYTLVLSPSNGSASTPAGTPYGITATLTSAGNAPVTNAKITFTVPSGDTATTWSSDTSSPTPTGPTRTTATTNSQGQATVEAAFEPNLSNQTVQATFTQDDTVATLAVAVGPSTPTSANWDELTPNPASAGSTVSMAVQLLDAYGFPVANGESAQYSFDDLGPWTGTTGTWDGLTGVVTGSFTVTKATRAAHDAPGDITVNRSPYFYSPSLLVNPGPMAYFYPAFGLANNTSGTWFSPYSWTNSDSLSQGPYNFIDNQGQFLANPPTNGSTYSVAGFGVDAYGNPIYAGTSAMVSCNAWNGGSCPSLPSTANGSWQNVGPFRSGSYNLVYTPQSGLDGVISSPTTTYDQFNVPGLRGWNVEVGNGSTILGSAGPGQNIALGTLPSGENSLNFSVEGLNQNNAVFTGYTNNGTDQEGVFCISAANGGVCPNGIDNPLTHTIPLGSSGTPNGYTGWSPLTTFQPGTYTLSIRAGQYGDGGGQNWTPTWANTHVTFTVTGPPTISSVTLEWTTEPVYSWDNGVPEAFGGIRAPRIEVNGSNFGTVANAPGDYDIVESNAPAGEGGATTLVQTDRYPGVTTYSVTEPSPGTFEFILGQDTPWISLTTADGADFGSPANGAAWPLLEPDQTNNAIAIDLPYQISSNGSSPWSYDPPSATVAVTNPQTGQTAQCTFAVPATFWNGRNVTAEACRP